MSQKEKSIQYPPTFDELPEEQKNVLKEKCVVLQNFNNKWNKTPAFCYNYAKLFEQLFGHIKKDDKQVGNLNLPLVRSKHLAFISPLKSQSEYF